MLKDALSGLMVSLIVGYVVCDFLARRLKLTYDADDTIHKHNLPVVTGFIERFLFTSYIGFEGTSPNLIAAMMGWLALKLAANWNHGTMKVTSEPNGDGNEHLKSTGMPTPEEVRKRAQISLIVGVVSLAFAYLGGKIWRS